MELFGVLEGFSGFVELQNDLLVAGNLVHSKQNMRLATNPLRPDDKPAIIHRVQTVKWSDVVEPI